MQEAARSADLTMREWLGSDHGARLSMWARAFGQSFHAVAARLWSSARTVLIMPLCDPYRPEWHYINQPIFLNEDSRTALTGKLPINEENLSAESKAFYQQVKTVKSHS